MSAVIDHVEVAAYTIPTDEPEADGTLDWASTTIVVVHAHAGPHHGLGWTYADRSAATLIASELAGAVRGLEADAPRTAWSAMVRAVRNEGRPGIAGAAISAVDLALWDLHAQLLEVPLASLLGVRRRSVPVYGSGGFTSYDPSRLRAQLGRWVEQGIPGVKMKIGDDPDEAVRRAVLVRDAIGDDPALFVDANGAYAPKPAIAVAQRLADDAGVTWFEEPVSSDDLAGLREVRELGPASIEVAAGEYGYDAAYFNRMLGAGAVDVLQADVSRCGGITGLLMVDALCHAAQRPLSLHCAPALHAHAACALLSLRHLEYFHDHVRIERRLFDGFPDLRDGELWPDFGRPGNGLTFNRELAEPYAAKR